MKKLNFGCGADIRKNWDNVDIQKSKKLTKSFDFDIIPYPLKDDTYDYILMSQVIEHVQKPDNVLKELWRICKKDAIIRIETPYYNNKGAFSDMQHTHYFSEHTFEVFVDQTTLINKKKIFEINELKLTPTKIGKFFPKKLREKMSMFIGGLISQVHVELKVIK